MIFTQIFRQAFATFRAHKMRTFLTMFGIVWGIASVILLVGLGRGFTVDQKKHMETLGKDLVIVWGGRTSSQVGGLAAGREITLIIDDARLIRDECYLVKKCEPRNAPADSRGERIQLRESWSGWDVASIPGFSIFEARVRALDH